MTLPSSSHILSQFDDDLTVLRDLVLRMGGLVEDQLRDALAALAGGDGELALRVVEGDREIDRIELRSDEEVARVLALRAPLGSDLRTVLTLSRTVNELERIGDEAKKTARVARRSRDGGHRDLAVAGSVLAMGDIARAMLHAALNALVRLDLALTERVRADDERLDAAFKSAMDEAKGSLRSAPDHVDAALDLAFVAKSLERIGDHSRNIANHVHYLVEGRDVRHPKLARD